LKVYIVPEQTVALATEIVGTGLTETFTMAVLDATHPAELVPVTEYELFITGETVLLPDENV
jgi:hypothetical protein